MNLIFEKTDINLLLSETCNDLKVFTLERAITYELLLPPISLTTWVDPTLIKQIFTDLIKYSIHHAHYSVCFKLMSFTSNDTVFKVEFSTDTSTNPLFEDERRNVVDRESFIGTLRAKYAVERSGIALSISEKGIIVSIPMLHAGNAETTMGLDKANGVNYTHQKTAPEKPIVLLVENDREIFAYLNKELKSTYTILRAPNGHEALLQLAINAVQLVLTAHENPIMDGVNLCRHIKASAKYGHIPVLFFTPVQAVEMKIEALMSGADACIENPCSPAYLRAQIHNILVNRKIVEARVSNNLSCNKDDLNDQAATGDFIARLHAIIQENTADMDLTVDELAKRMNMSRPTLYRRVKQYSALTPNEMITISKLQKAAELLTQRRYTIAQIAAIVGYSVQSNFSRDFHKHFGTPPSIYSMGMSGRIDVA
ncbi:helix-turn-helix domain-containing protein [Sphingobacterium deserti]|uniref:Histidine kinase n=1 Tax=Sphingobacterium deserti TaxID=1229276 RepID=A0A0B8T090_9SPHI|nr:helix-turn-helix domain-containing protein [Sphingobacterium deserti]KGE13611.1 histidine kinase [Sphingobacterium deserti]